MEKQKSFESQVMSVRLKQKNIYAYIPDKCARSKAQCQGDIGGSASPRTGLAFCE